VRSLSLRSQLTIWCVLVVVLVLAFFAADVMIIQQRISMRRVDRELEGTHVQLTHMLREELAERDAPTLAAEESRDVIASDDRLIAVLGARGELLATSFMTPSIEEIFAERSRTPGVWTVETPGGAWRLHAGREAMVGGDWLLLIGTPLNAMVRDQQEIRQAILLGIPIALVFAAAGGLWLASAGLRPITRMARRAAGIAPTGADDLGPPLRDDELGQLTSAFNTLVARLRSALEAQRQFMADASHELRNPVSVIRTASDLALSREHRDESDYREALGMTAAQSRRLGTLVEDMLVLARADGGGYPLRPVDFFLDDVIDECRRSVSVLAAERRVAVTTTGASDVAIRGDQELIQRLLVNLLQNAVQHSPVDGIVRVDLAVAERDVCIRVIDGGPGIATADVARIFDRFVQLDPSRRSEGSGLGLTIARWIAGVHRGSLVVESTGPAGTTFRLTLPAIPDETGIEQPTQAAKSSSVHLRESTILRQVPARTDQ
jgi:signal transduction histidine kinase